MDDSRSEARNIQDELGTFSAKKSYIMLSKTTWYILKGTGKKSHTSQAKRDSLNLKNNIASKIEIIKIYTNP